MTTPEEDTAKLQRLAKDRFERPLPKRFYTHVSVSPENGVLLDGRKVKTPLKNPLLLPSRPMADAVAAEWAGIETDINPALMPITKLANTALDRAVSERGSVITEMIEYAGTDLVCYWSDRPPELVARQTAHWQPVLSWVASELGVTPIRAVGITHVAQPQALSAAVRDRLESLNQWMLTATYLLTTLTGSVFLALMQQAGALSAEGAWNAANVDEDYQISQWGEDWEAKIRREARSREFAGLVHFLSLLR